MGQRRFDQNRAHESPIPSWIINYWLVNEIDGSQFDQNRPIRFWTIHNTWLQSSERKRQKVILVASNFTPLIDSPLNYSGFDFHIPFFTAANREMGKTIKCSKIIQISALIGFQWKSLSILFIWIFHNTTHLHLRSYNGNLYCS